MQTRGKRVRGRSLSCQWSLPTLFYVRCTEAMDAVLTPQFLQRPQNCETSVSLSLRHVSSTGHVACPYSHVPLAHKRNTHTKNCYQQIIFPFNNSHYKFYLTILALSLTPLLNKYPILSYIKKHYT